MDVTTFRWVLVIVGVVIVAAIFLFGNPNRKRKPRASRHREPARGAPRRVEPTLGRASPGGDDEDGEPGQQAELDMGPEGAALTDEPPKPKKPAPPPPDKIVTLYLLARDAHRITGVDLLDATVKAGLVFGEHDIFHRMQEGDKRPVFSMANLTPPGHFDKDSWGTLETPGVTLFMTLPGPMRGLDAWDAMHATARRLSELLHADILDDEREPLTRERGGRVREELREYDRTHADAE